MQAGRLSERIEIIPQAGTVTRTKGDSYPVRGNSFFCHAAIKLAKSDLIDDDGVYFTSLDISIETHFHVRKRVKVGDLIKRTDNAVTGVQGADDRDMVTTYEVTSVDPNRALNRVYITARRLNL